MQSATTVNVLDEVAEDCESCRKIRVLQGGGLQNESYICMHFVLCLSSSYTSEMTGNRTWSCSKRT